MNRRSLSLRCALTSVVALGLASCATRPSTVDDAVWQRDVRAALERQNDADSLVASAMLTDWPPATVGALHPDVSSRLQEAAALRPEDRPIAVLRVITCMATAECDAADAGAALRQIDPGNGIADWPALTLAVAGGDPAAIDEAIHVLSVAPRFNVYWNANVMSTADALARTAAPVAPAGRAGRTASDWVGLAIGVLALRGVPPTSPFATACRGPDLAPARRRDCLAVLATLMSSDSVILQALASSLTLRVAAPDSSEARAAHTWRRTFDWRSQQTMLAFKPFRLRKIERVHVTAFRANAREEDAIRAFLIAFDLPPDPPANWTPPTRTPAR